MRGVREWAALSVALLAIGGASPQSARAQARPPNVVFLYADDLGYGDVGCYGATAAKTPNVDRLAAGGLRFTNAYATSATCTPSRFSLLTGQYAFRDGGIKILPGDAPLIIRPGRETIPAVLRRAGYRTGIVGKWHLGLGEAGTPLDWNRDIKPGPLETGFDYSFVMAATGDRVPCVYVEGHRVVGLDPSDPIKVSYDQPFPGERTGKEDRASLAMDWNFEHNDAVVHGIPRIGFMVGGTTALWQDDQMAKVFADKAIDFIERERQSPFFLYLATQDIHVPRVPAKDFVGATAMGPRGDAIVQFDWLVGQIVDALERRGLLDDTLIILSSDNGPVLDDGYRDEAVERVGDHKPAGPLRAGKYSIFEGGTRVPMITYWRNGRVRPGVSGALVSQVDFLASLAKLAGQNFSTADARDSQDQLAALLGEDKAGRASLVEQAAGVALRRGDWKYVRPGMTRDGLGPWTYVRVAEPGLLFNLAADPGERTDEAARQPEKLAELRAELDQIAGPPPRPTTTRAAR